MRLHRCKRASRGAEKAPDCSHQRANQHENAEYIDNQGLEVEIKSAVHDMDAEVGVEGHDRGRDGEDDEAVKR